MDKVFKKAAKISQKEKFLRAVKEENCDPIEVFEKKLKKISRISAGSSKNKTKK